MGQTLVLDYSFARPSPSAIAAAGAVGVVRYLSHDADKAIDAGELHALQAVGLAVALVWEDGARAATLGRPQGHVDAAAANAQADALGWPEDRPIFYAVDFDTAGDQHQLWSVVEYLRGAAGGGTRPVRVYGSYEVVEAARAAQFGAGWQTLAWSRDRVSPHACLIQTTRTTPIPQTDVNVIGDGFDDWGQHPLPASPLEEDPLPIAYVIPETDQQPGDGVLAVSGITPPRPVDGVEWAALEAAGARMAGIPRDEWLTLRSRAQG